MRKFLLLLVLFSLLLTVPQIRAQSTTGSCFPNTFSATGRVLVAQYPNAYLGSVQASFYTTGSPTSVAIQIEAGHQPAATQTPFIVLWPSTSTTGANLGQAGGGFEFWYANVTTLSGGTSPTVVLTTCFQPGSSGAPAQGVSLIDINRTVAANATIELTTASAELLDYRACTIWAQEVNGAGTTPTLNLYIQDSADGSTWCDRVSFTQATTGTSTRLAGLSGFAAGFADKACTDGTLAAASINDGPFQGRLRLKYVIGGTAPSYTTHVRISCK